MFSIFARCPGAPRLCFSLKRQVWATVLILLLPFVSSGQTSASPDVIQRLEALEKRLRQSEQDLATRNRQLDDALKRIGQLENRLGEVPTTASVAQVPPPPAPEPEPKSADMDMDHDAMMSLPNGPHLNIRGYGDIGYGYSRVSGKTPSTQNSFSLGQLDLYITSRITDKLGVVMENVFEADRDNFMSLDVERILLQYRQNKYFAADVGRYHTSIGYYNTTYHHSRWMQTAMDRPLLFAFEDAGGPLPTHNVGLSVSGQIPSGGLRLAYVAEIGNGRSFRIAGAEPVQNLLDDNRGKSLNFAISSRPDAIPGLRVGASFLTDRLSPVAAPSISQKILAGYVVYVRGRVEFLNEAIWMRHAQEIPKLGQRVTAIPGGYSQFSYRFGEFRPWVRVEMLNPSSGDPVAQRILMTTSLIRRVSTGLRYDFSEYAAFKVGFDRLTQNLMPAANVVSGQLSFTF